MKEAYIVDVSMGYGHQRTAWPLKEIAFEKKIINANNYPKIPQSDQKIWQRSQRFYEGISKIKRFPLIGNYIFEVYDRFQTILSYYPKRDLSKPTFNLKTTYSLIKNGWGKDLIERLKQKPLPFISTFYIPAFMAEVFDWPEDIYIIVCDADIGRHWVPLDPKKSKIKYFAPCSWAKDRLKLYGVKEENIFLTGYPLPKELIGNKMEIIKKDMGFRLLNLDPKKEFFSRYGVLIEKYIGRLPKESNHPLTLMFSVGGAGVQKEIGVQILKSLSSKIKKGEIKLILSAGIKKEINGYFVKNIVKLGLEELLGRNIEIIFETDIASYFEKFNEKLKTTDILWTKPSELSFYSGLGIPIIIAPPVGSQEDFNKRWLLHIGSGILQENPKYTHEWLFDLLKGGRLAEAGMNGFVEIEKMGTYKIEEIIQKT